RGSPGWVVRGPPRDVARTHEGIRAGAFPVRDLRSYPIAKARRRFRKCVPPDRAEVRRAHDSEHGQRVRLTLEHRPARSAGVAGFRNSPVQHLKGQSRVAAIFDERCAEAQLSQRSGCVAAAIDPPPGAPDAAATVAPFVEWEERHVMRKSKPADA